MNFVQDLIPLNTPNNRRPAIKRRIEYIVVHNTGNPTSTARQERNWLTNPSNKVTASFHYAVDDNNIIQCIPDDEVTWQAGDGQGKGNINGLSFEICESGNYKQAEANAVKFIAEKLIEYGLTIDKVKPHKFFSGKNCPHIILPYWSDFIAKIQAEYDRVTKKEVTQEHWAEKYFKVLNARGIGINEKRFDEPITRGEQMAMIDKVLTYLGK